MYDIEKHKNIQKEIEFQEDLGILFQIKEEALLLLIISFFAALFFVACNFFITETILFIIFFYFFGFFAILFLILAFVVLVNFFVLKSRYFEEWNSLGYNFEYNFNGYNKDKKNLLQKEFDKMCKQIKANDYEKILFSGDKDNILFITPIFEDYKYRVKQKEKEMQNLKEDINKLKNYENLNNQKKVNKNIAIY